VLRDVIRMRVRDDAMLARPVGIKPQIEIGQVQSFLVFNSEQLRRPFSLAFVLVKFRCARPSGDCLAESFAV